FVACLSTGTPSIPTLSLHDALPIFPNPRPRLLGVDIADDREDHIVRGVMQPEERGDVLERGGIEVLHRADRRMVIGVLRRIQAGDRKSTRLNSSHRTISYAVCCLKK